jgi:hypothetical protein
MGIGRESGFEGLWPEVDVVGKNAVDSTIASVDRDDVFGGVASVWLGRPFYQMRFAFTPVCRT